MGPALVNPCVPTAKNPCVPSVPPKKTAPVAPKKPALGNPCAPTPKNPCAPTTTTVNNHKEIIGGILATGAAIGVLGALAGRTTTNAMSTLPPPTGTPPTATLAPTATSPTPTPAPTAAP